MTTGHHEYRGVQRNRAEFFPPTCLFVFNLRLERDIVGGVEDEVGIGVEGVIHRLRSVGERLGIYLEGTGENIATNSRSAGCGAGGNLRIDMHLRNRCGQNDSLRLAFRPQQHGVGRILHPHPTVLAILVAWSSGTGPVATGGAASPAA